MQRGDQIIIAIAVIIEARAALAGDRTQQIHCQATLALAIHLGHIGHHLQGIQRPTGVAINQLRQCIARLLRQQQILPTVATLAIAHRLLQHLYDVLRLQRLEQIDPCARQQRRVQFEGGVLGGGADKGNGAILDMRQEGILLTLIETMHLIDEQDRAPTDIAILARPLDRLADLLDPRGDRRDALHLGMAIARNQLR